MKKKTQLYLIPSLIMILPFLNYLYMFFPETESVTIFNIKFTSNYYESFSTMMWIYMTKLISVITYLVWFFTCRYWWRFSIIIPLTFSVFQFISVINDEQSISDYGFIFGLIFTFPIILAIIYITKQFRKYKKIAFLNSTIDTEINQVLSILKSSEKANTKLVKNRFEDLKEIRGEMDEKDYLTQLLILKDSLDIN